MNGPVYHIIKIVLIGNSGSGKTSLLRCFSGDSFTASYITTTGADFRVRCIELDGESVKLQLWDTGGQERFQSRTSSYYRGAHGIIVVFDVTDMSSFFSVRNWLYDIDSNSPVGVNKLIIGHKVDLDSKRTVSYAQAKSLADSYGVEYIEASSKVAVNVERAFITLAAFARARLLADIHTEKPKDIFKSEPRRQATLSWTAWIFGSKQSSDPVRVVSDLAAIRQLCVSRPVQIRSPSTSGSLVNTITIQWTGQNFDAADASYVYQLQKCDRPAVSEWTSWEDLGISYNNTFTLSNPLSVVVNVTVRVRSTICKLPVQDIATFCKRRNVWSNWGDTAQFTINAANASSDADSTPDIVVSSHSDWMPYWTADILCKNCQRCNAKFSAVSLRKHHCRSCGKCVCYNCCPTNQSWYVENYGRVVRICTACYRSYILDIQIKKARVQLPEPNFSAAGLKYLLSIPALEIECEDGNKFWAEGASSIVYKGKYFGIPVAIKQYKRSFICLSESLSDNNSSESASVNSKPRNQIEMEMHVYKQCADCEHVVSMLMNKSNDQTGYPFIATEIVDKYGTLLSVLKDRSIPLSMAWKLEVMIEICAFLEFIHFRQIVHVDLKAENCVVVSPILSNSSNSSSNSIASTLIKVFDFNSCTEYGRKSFEDIDNLGRTPSHSSPDIIHFMQEETNKKSSKRIEFNDKYDIYSFGILMAELVSRGLYYENAVAGTVTNFEDAIVAGCRPQVLCEKDDVLPDGLHQLIEQCWNKDPFQRPNASAVIRKLKRIRDDYHYEMQRTTEEINNTSKTSALVSYVAAHPVMSTGTPSACPKYVVVLPANCFASTIFSLSSLVRPNSFLKASQYEKEIPGLVAVKAGESTLDGITCSGPTKQLELGVIYQQHPGRENKYLRMSEFVPEMARAKEEEFRSIMNALGAKEIACTNVESRRDQLEMHASVTASVLATIGVKGKVKQASSNTKTHDSKYAKPKLLKSRPFFDDKRRYLFYYDEEEWQGIVLSRLGPNPMTSTKVTVSFDSEKLLSADIVAKIKHLGGLGAGGYHDNEDHFESTYSIEFYTPEDYHECNKNDIKCWSTKTVQEFLDYLKLRQYKALFAASSISGCTLLLDNFKANLLKLGLPELHAAQIEQAIKMQIEGHSEFVR